MSLVKLRSDARHQLQPLVAQRRDLLDLARVAIRNALKVIELIVHQAHVEHRQCAAGNHLHVSAQGLAGQHDALISFIGGHGGILPRAGGAVYGEAWGWR